MPRSAIRTATAGCSRRSSCACPDAWTPNATTFTSSTDLATALRRAAAAHGEHEKRTGGSTMRTGRTGTPSTSSRSRPASSCRHEQRPRRPTLSAFGKDRLAACRRTPRRSSAQHSSWSPYHDPIFDAIVIGAGQAGPSLAGRLTAAGMKVALIERNLFGGTCVNTGCMPTKTLGRQRLCGPSGPAGRRVWDRDRESDQAST